MSHWHLLHGLAEAIIPKPDGLPEITTDDNLIKVIFTLVLNIVGAITLLIITLGGLKFVLSRGNPQETAKARETILYALVGLVIVILARVIVAFVFNKVGT